MLSATTTPDSSEAFDRQYRHGLTGAESLEDGASSHKTPPRAVCRTFRLYVHDLTLRDSFQNCPVAAPIAARKLGHNPWPNWAAACCLIRQQVVAESGPAYGDWRGFVAQRGPGPYSGLSHALRCGGQPHRQGSRPVAPEIQSASVMDGLTNRSTQVEAGWRSG